MAKKSRFEKDQEANRALEICKEAQNTMWCVEGLRYDDACKMIEELNEYKGIYANITVGGVKISCGGFVDTMHRIAKKYNAVPERGLTRQVESVILKGENHIEKTPFPKK